MSYPQDQSADRSPLASFDITHASGISQELSDSSLDDALNKSKHVQGGGKLKIKSSSRTRLDRRIQTASLTPVDPDPIEMPVDQEFASEDVIFKDSEANPDDTIPDDDPIEDEPAIISHVDPQIETIQDPTQWTINALKTIHSDIQLIKPLIDQVPLAVSKVSEIQLVLGEVTSGFIELKNTVSNMETIIARNRMDIAKLTDLIKNMSALQPPIQPVTPSPITTKIITTDEENLDKLITELSQRKGFDPEQEIILRNMLLIHDKNIIDETLKRFGTIRQPLSSEIEQIIQINTGSSKSMQSIYKILSNLLPTPGRSTDICSGPCKSLKTPE